MSGVRAARTVALQYHYIGDPDTDGSLRLLRSGNDFTVEERIDGSWVARDITGNSLVMFDPVIKDASDVDPAGDLHIYLSGSQDDGNLVHVDVNVVPWDYYTIVLNIGEFGQQKVASLRLDIKVNDGQTIAFGELIPEIGEIVGLDHIYLPEDAVSSLLIDKPAGQDDYYIRQLV